ncbi:MULTISPECIES: hypothetical protein [unclassified Bradyrhizobium]|uniref:hypothetical protein n=1 Tax=unclassified Bradyrhizobium TaxID=2631580 RepID=UPI001BABB84E|nr:MULTISPECIES: hypothetical protein [unclassified Bradyrhizobium]MBR1205768.1 hypothetical protein [Bradyrhizobium sp. AUGA SZCCT0124]MBR1315843.1 hypothetical protein [Bradyrhizobium sp. AUGA SZCCT0051]MBR1338095.1 hypothetical protein [Bradyrhizobium sp. AUGA SZCCT0105]MBR1355750.1 hypothetical protein [Bradyrhizobium sp. AUGA SZCCT0045]
MGSLFAAFKSIKRVVTGEVVEQMETRANGGFTTMSLRLKQESGSGEYYVVLAELSGGNSQYVAFTREEFGRFSEAVDRMRDRLTAAAS